jgi:glycosyltransferase involved in cell wall biosynthesis
VLAQTYKDFEIIVVDDGSGDETLKILKEYIDKVFVILKTNGGTASALNRGIKHALYGTGDWIKWLSADDEMLPDCLENLVKMCSNPMAIYYTNYHIIDAKGKHVKDFVEPKRPVSDLWTLFYGNGSSSFIHKNVFDRCGLFDESLRFGEDYEFWLRATMLYNVNLTLIPEFTVNYRNHPDQLTHKVGGRNDIIIKQKIKDQIITS